MIWVNVETIAVEVEEEEEVQLEMNEMKQEINITLK